MLAMTQNVGFIFIQGDQSSLGKNRPNSGPTIFFLKINTKLVPRKRVIQKVNLQKMPKASKRPKVKNSSNPVTLFSSDTFGSIFLVAEWSKKPEQIFSQQFAQQLSKIVAKNVTLKG
jgi:hypothetical protein